MLIDYLFSFFFFFFSGKEIERDTNHPGIKMAEGQKNLSPFRLPLESRCWQMTLPRRRKFRWGSKAVREHSAAQSRPLSINVFLSLVAIGSLGFLSLFFQHVN